MADDRMSERYGFQAVSEDSEAKRRARRAIALREGRRSPSASATDDRARARRIVALREGRSLQREVSVIEAEDAGYRPASVKLEHVRIAPGLPLAVDPSWLGEVLSRAR